MSLSNFSLFKIKVFFAVNSKNSRRPSLCLWHRGGRGAAVGPVQALIGQWTWYSFHMALRSWPPPLLVIFTPPPPSKDPSPLSRALNPPQSAPLQHINSGTGTNCPTLDVLETQIASAASAPQTPQHSTPNRRKPSKEESQNCWFLCPVFY